MEVNWYIKFFIHYVRFCFSKYGLATDIPEIKDPERSTQALKDIISKLRLYSSETDAVFYPEPSLAIWVI